MRDCFQWRIGRMMCIDMKMTRVSRVLIYVLSSLELSGRVLYKSGRNRREIAADKVDSWQCPFNVPRIAKSEPQLCFEARRRCHGTRKSGKHFCGELFDLCWARTSLLSKDLFCSTFPGPLGSVRVSKTLNQYIPVDYHAHHCT